ncbi:ROK family glucokinase [Lacrimispora saccharolytica]|uniref:ROK family glucokinase n=1 Tax=Lacrimispora saccharolytica TaxID=84030 RepID=UPI00265CEBF6|nr:ROK family glucokinase [Lacrimispora saccharolytica]MBS7330060.1 ROK family glucokinase [Lachnospiraceae bacterium]MCF2657283.1 ROK family glucokinase [Lacrimispora saccharolytica]MCI7556999.1 ROK family glucokinase [Lachnospiraceae bacterium]MDD7547870.1 ROK family glucokinase [Lachnospiraceae bacterium]
MKKYVFGVDVGGTTVKMGYFDIEGNLIEKWEIPTRTEDKGVNIIPDIAGSILVKLAQKDIDKKEVAGVGIGVPGPVKEDGTVLVAVNLGWDKRNTNEQLEDLLGIPVKTANDANVAALGEMWRGGGQGYEDVVAVTLGTGVGGGVIIGGKVIAGSNGAGGEIGHIHLEDNESEECGCKGHGCLEQYASATGVVRLAKKKLADSSKPSVLRDDEVTAKAVWDAVKADDELAKEVANIYGEYLGKGLAAVAAVVNPQVFVIGGGVSKAGRVVIDYLEPYFDKYAFPGTKNAKFVLAKLGNDAGIYGAAKLVLG